MKRADGGAAPTGNFSAENPRGKKRYGVPVVGPVGYSSMFTYANVK